MLLVSLNVLLLIATVVTGKYLGCFEDSEDRLLPGYRMDLKDINTPGKCTYICRQLGFKYAGVEQGNLCYCGNKKLDATKKRTEEECQSPCPVSTKRCGGPSSLGVYSTVLQSDGLMKNKTFVGCYIDENDLNQLLPDFRINLIDINSPGRCLHICNELGFQYAGVELGTHCFCGHKRPTEENKTSDNECQMTCPHSTMKCGDRWRLAVYSNSEWRNSNPAITEENLNRNVLGCFEDSASKRLLSEFRVPLNNINNPKRCLYICRQLGYIYAGVENGNECFCGNRRPEEVKKISENECQTSCPFSTEKCGGDLRLFVYTTELLPPKDVSAPPVGSGKFCSPDRFCNAGHTCCSSATCCPIGTNCCFGGLRCCHYTFQQMSSTEANSAYWTGV